MADAVRLPLDMFFEREARHPNKRYLVQPLSGGRVEELTWGDVGDQARRAASWLRGRDLPPGSRIAIISKNCAHWIVADLAIWMAGHVSVPLYPNLTGESVHQVLAHSETALAFIGKLDDWPAMASGIPEGVATIALPIHPEGTFDYQWSELQAETPIRDNPRTAAEQLATIIYTSGTTGTPGRNAELGNFASPPATVSTCSRPVKTTACCPTCRCAMCRAHVRRNGLALCRADGVLRREPRHLPRRPQARPSHRHLRRAAHLDQVPDGGLREDARAEARPPAQAADHPASSAARCSPGSGWTPCAWPVRRRPVPEALLHWYKRLGLTCSRSTA